MFVGRCCNVLFPAIFLPASRIGFRPNSVVDVKYITNVRRPDLIQHFSFASLPFTPLIGGTDEFFLGDPFVYTQRR